MSNVNTVISFERLVQDFDSLFRRRVFRLETLDWYDAPNEHEPYRRFLAGEPVDPAWREPWKRLVRGHRAAGRIMQRVHVVSEPVSDYVRFELAHVYPANVEAGEDVRVLGRGAADATMPLYGDYWLFDDELVAYLEYDDRGSVDAVRLIRGEGAMGIASDIRDKALNLSVPLAEYVAEHNITEERTQAA